MERLTYRALDQNGNPVGKVWYDMMSVDTGENIFPSSEKEEKVLKKLADYEDTGLTPEQIEEDFPDVRMIEEKLASYEDAEKQGLLIRLPCKIGDKVYQLWSACGEYAVIEQEFSYDLISEFGKSVFLSYDEAERLAEKYNAE